MKRLALMLLVATFVTPALAQVRAPAVVVHNMDEDLIEGVVLRVPEMPVVTTTPKHTHKNLIQVRKSFAPELLASVSKL
jgi:hypothetical protein